MNTIDSNIVGVNNFITDLLDGMKAKRVAKALLSEGGFCIYQKEAGALIPSDCDGDHDPTELSEDLEALGFYLRREPEGHYYRYDPNGIEDQDSMFFIVAMGYSGEFYQAEARFTLITNITGNLKQTLRKHNPVKTRDYADSVY